MDFKINFTKLKEEDKRFMLSETSSQIQYNSQRHQNNIALCSSYSAFIIASMSVIITLPHGSDMQSFLFLLFLGLLAVCMIIFYARDSLKINKQQKILLKNHETWLKHYLAYVTIKEKRKA